MQAMIKRGEDKGSGELKGHGSAKKKSFDMALDTRCHSGI